MSMLKQIILITLVISVLDAVFLGSMSSFFKKQVFAVQHSELKIDYVALVLCYIVMIFMIYYFVIRENRDILYAGLLGWGTILTYEFTTKAILTNWSYLTVFIDGLWGGILFMLTTFIVKKLDKLI